MQLSRRGFFGVTGSIAALGWLHAPSASAGPGAPVPPPHDMMQQIRVHG